MIRICTLIVVSVFLFPSAAYCQSNESNKVVIELKPSASMENQFQSLVKNSILDTRIAEKTFERIIDRALHMAKKPSWVNQLKLNGKTVSVIRLKNEFVIRVIDLEQLAMDKEKSALPSDVKIGSFYRVTTAQDSGVLILKQGSSVIYLPISKITYAIVGNKAKLLGQ